MLSTVLLPINFYAEYMKLVLVTGKDKRAYEYIAGYRSADNYPEF